MDCRLLSWKYAVGAGAAVLAGAAILRALLNIRIRVRPPPPASRSPLLRDMGLLERWYAASPHTRNVFYAAEIDPTRIAFDPTCPHSTRAVVALLAAAHPILNVTIADSGDAWAPAPLTPAAVSLLTPSPDPAAAAMDWAAHDADAPFPDGAPLWRIRWIIPSSEPSSEPSSSSGPPPQWVVLLSVHHAVVDGVTGFDLFRSLISALLAVAQTGPNAAASPAEIPRHVALPPPLDHYVDTRPRVRDILAALAELILGPSPVPDYAIGTHPDTSRLLTTPSPDAAALSLSSARPRPLSLPPNIVSDLLSVARRERTSLQAVFVAAAVEALAAVHTGPPVNIALSTPVSLVRNALKPGIEPPPSSALLPFTGGVRWNHVVHPDAVSQQQLKQQPLTAFDWDLAREYRSHLRSHVPGLDSATGMIALIPPPAREWVAERRARLRAERNLRDVTVEVSNLGPLAPLPSGVSNVVWGQTTVCSGAVYAIDIASLGDTIIGTVCVANELVRPALADAFVAAFQDAISRAASSVHEL